MDDDQIVWIDYEVKIDDEVLETTNAERAEELGLEARSGPMPLIVGSDGVLPGLMEAIKGAEPDVEIEVEIPPEKAYGERDPKLIEIYPIPKLRRMGVDMEEEGVVKMKDREGRIIRRSGSRAWIDFNHPHAGESLHYKFTVVRVADEVADQVTGIIDIYYQMSDQFGVEIGDDRISLTVPATAKYDPHWQFAKFSIQRELLDRLGVSKVLVIEEYEPVGDVDGEPAGEAEEEASGDTVDETSTEEPDGSEDAADENPEEEPEAEEEVSGDTSDETPEEEPEGSEEETSDGE